MVSFKKSQHYIHLSMMDRSGMYQPQPILVVGSSGSGKSILVEKAVEEAHKNIKKMISFWLVDETDEIESGFAMFPGTDKEQLKNLSQQGEKPEAHQKTMLWYICGDSLKNWHKKKKGLPEGRIITLSAKKILKREESMFLLGVTKETRAVRLMLECGEMLKSDQDLSFVNIHGRKLTRRSKKKYFGKEMDFEDDATSDKKDLKDVQSVLRLFDSSIMPDDFELNFDVNQMLKMPGYRHVIVYKGLKDDSKLRDFVFFHILNEIARHIKDSRYPVTLIIEEAGSVAPYKGEGHKAILSAKMGDLIGTLRKTGRGVTIFMVGRVWSGIAEQVRAECRKQILFHIELDDMLKYLKSRSLGRKAKDIMERLRTGECILKGYETRIIKSKVPGHGHKHVYQNFMEEYKKHYELKNFKDELSLVDKAIAASVKKYKDYIGSLQQEAKKEILKDHRKKLRTSNEKEKLLGMKEEIKVQRKEQKSKRDRAVIDCYNELIFNNEKASTRKIMKILNDKGIEISKGTVHEVLKKMHPTQEGEEESLDNSDLSDNN